jgi:hypothetical protein
MNKETYTKIFLKQAGKSVNELSIKEYFPLWWQNTRKKDSGGLRLTDEGYRFCTEDLELTFFEVPLPKDFKPTVSTIIWLDQFIDCPYFLDNLAVYVTSERKALELHLFSGDIRKYGLTKALKRQDPDEKSS